MKYPVQHAALIAAGLCIAVGGCTQRITPETLTRGGGATHGSPDPSPPVVDGTPPTQPQSQPTVDVTTQHNDLARTGANLQEAILTTSNVNVQQFGLLFTRPVDGMIYAQPLYLSHMAMPDGNLHNVVYVATMHNSVYAFDADSPGANTPLWTVNLGPSVPTSDFQPYYKDIANEVGILSTPVIDRDRGVIYIVAQTKPAANTWQHSIHMLSLATGAEQTGSPQVIQASVPGTGQGSQNGTVVLDSLMHLQRPGLTLVAGHLFIAFASHGDATPYHGWVLAYDALTLQQQGVFNTTPNGGAGGIWMSGAGLAVDDQNNVYISTGNGFAADATVPEERPESLVRLTLNGTGLVMSDYFTPSNWMFLDDNDLDFGTSGVLLVPNSALAISSGKTGILYVMDRGNLGQLTPGDTGLLQAVTLSTPNHLHGAPVYWNGPDMARVYLWPENSPMYAYSIVNNQVSATPVSTSTVQAPQPNAMPGAMLSISAHGNQAGTGIVWANLPTNSNANQATVSGILRAFDATDLTHELWNSHQNQARDDFGSFAKFSAPTVINGRVYLATFSNQLAVYGLLP